MNTAMERTVRAAVVIHVGVVVAFLIGVAVGAEVRTLCALGGGVLATVAWIGWTRSIVVEAQLRQPPPTRPIMSGGPTVALSAARAESAVPRHAPTGS